MTTLKEWQAVNEELKKEFHWLKAQISSLERGIELLKLKLSCAEAERESYKSMVRQKHKVEYEEFKKEW